MNFLRSLFSRIASFFRSLFGYAMRHKIQAGLAIIVVLLLAWWGYSSYQKSVTTTQYVLAVARTAPIEETVTGSGQVASEHQLNLSPKASGTITSVRVKAGDQVVAGQVIATVDDTDAEKSLRDAATSLESARISYLQSQSSNANTVQKSEDAVFADSATAYSDMNTALTGINTIMQGNEVSGSYSQKNVYAYAQLFNNNPTLVAYRDRLIADYATANDAYEAASADYNRAGRDTNTAAVATLANETYQTAVKVSQAAKDLNDYLNQVNGRYSPTDTAKPNILSTHLASSLAYANTMNSDVNTLLGAENDLASAIQTSGGTDTTSLSEESAQLNYQKAQNSYQDAKDALADYVVVAPFAGTIASVPLQKFDTAGSGTTVAVLTTKQQIATLSLNEVDAAKVAAGQKATLTFDAIDGLTINGTVAEVDTVGTVSQGVVSYTVKIGFDSQDSRILPGMTVNATIVTASKDAALVVPSSAVKTQGTQSYIQVATYANGQQPQFGMGSSTRQFRTASSTGGFGSTTRSFGGSGSSSFTGARTAASGTGLTVDASAVTIRRVNVTTGITSDTMTEITSGLNPGEFVVSQSLNATGKSTSQTPSLLNLFGGRRPTTTTSAAGGARTTTGATGARAGGGAAAGNAVFVGKGG